MPEDYAGTYFNAHNPATIAHNYMVGMPKATGSIGPVDTNWASGFPKSTQDLIKANNWDKAAWDNLGAEGQLQALKGQQAGMAMDKAGQTDWQGMGGLAMDGVNTALGIASYFDTRRMNNANLDLMKSQKSIMEKDAAQRSSARNSYSTAFGGVA